MTISKSFIDSVQSGDFNKAVRSINRFAFENKNFDKAGKHLAHLLDTVELADILEELDSTETRYFNRIQNEVIPAGTDSADLNEAFEAMEDFVNVVALGLSNGLMIAGPGGTGKTWTVNECLEELGMQEDIDYISIKGFSTPKGLFDILEANSDKLVIFDDCDSIFKDLAGLNILKAVLDTYPTRKVTWANANGGDINTFQFTGRIIFISNLDPTTTNNTNFQAVMTRVLSVVVGGSKEEIRERMIQLLPKIASDLPQSAQDEIAEFITDNYRRVTLSLRFIVHLVGLYKYDKTKWKKLAFVLK
jgi:Cdc6-like AAA superfamily ATPase